jgi:hypothetical protein
VRPVIRIGVDAKAQTTTGPTSFVRRSPPRWTSARTLTRPRRQPTDGGSPRGADDRQPWRNPAQPSRPRPRAVSRASDPGLHRRRVPASCSSGRSSASTRRRPRRVAHATLLLRAALDLCAPARRPSRRSPWRADRPPSHARPSRSAAIVIVFPILGFQRCRAPPHPDRARQAHVDAPAPRPPDDVQRRRRQQRRLSSTSSGGISPDIPRDPGGAAPSATAARRGSRADVQHQFVG